MDAPHQFDDIVAGHESLAQAAKELRRIAAEHPGLFAEFAESWCKAQARDEPVKADQRQSSPPSRRQRSARSFDRVQAAMLASGNTAMSMREIAELAGFTRGAIRHTIEVTHPNRFESTADLQRPRTRLWHLREDVSSQVEQPAGSTEVSTERVSPTEAVRAWFSRHPKGGPAKIIVRDLLNQIATASTKPANVVHGTIGNLERSGEIHVVIRDGRKHYLPTNSETA